MLKLSSPLDRVVLPPASDSSRAHLECMQFSLRASKVDLALELELASPLPIHSFENEGRYSPSDVLAQHPFYRQPNYLLLECPAANRQLSRNLLNCFCLRFYGESEQFFSIELEHRYSFERIKGVLAEGKIDIVVFPVAKDFRSLARVMADRYPDIALLVTCYEPGQMMDERYSIIAEQLRGEGYFALTLEEILNKQEYVSRLTAHALGQRGISRLRRACGDSTA